VEKIILVSMSRGAASFLSSFFCVVTPTLAVEKNNPISPTNIFAPDSTPAYSIYRLSIFELEILLAIFLVVFGLLAYAIVKFRQRGKMTRSPRRFMAASRWSWPGQFYLS
jgi:heme/copper-type cytochrome/quinol oxidase subunit 2